MWLPVLLVLHSIPAMARKLPSASLVKYTIDVKRVIERKLVMGIADGKVTVDGRDIYHANDLRVGLFQSTESF